MKVNLSRSLDTKFQRALKNDLRLLDQQIKSTIEDLKEATPKDTGYAASRWKSYKTEEYALSISLQNRFLIRIAKEAVYTIENDAEYITYLNAGWSRQAPAYFVEQTLFQNGFVPTFTKR